MTNSDSHEMHGHPVIFFDGLCNLCNAAVRYIIKRDPNARFKFCSLQSPVAHELLGGGYVQSNNLTSIILLQDKKVYIRSEAALRIARQLQSPIKFLYGFIIVPSIIRNWVYNMIAKNRYTWFGKRQECMVPDPKLATRFLN